MNCYRCGYEYSGPMCLVCGKMAPTPNNPVGADNDSLRIAVIVPENGALTAGMLDRLQTGVDHYQLDNASQPQQHIFVYTPGRAGQLFDLLQSTDQIKDRTILFNGRRRPYDTDLWLPLLWYVT
ncbi:hypothetical protein JXQ70_06240 [bacterium]|nr:hypothetical protein [bacterium]